MCIRYLLLYKYLFYMSLKSSPEDWNWKVTQVLGCTRSRHRQGIVRGGLSLDFLDLCFCPLKAKKKQSFEPEIKITPRSEDRSHESLHDICAFHVIESFNSIFFASACVIFELILTSCRCLKESGLVSLVP